MGWIDGFAPAGMGVLAAGWPGLREHLESLLLRKPELEDEQEEAPQTEDTDSEAV